MVTKKKLVHRATYDKLADAVYLYLTHVNGYEVSKTEELETPGGVSFMADYAKIAGFSTLVGLEFLGASNIFTQKFLDGCEQLESEEKEKEE